MTVERPKTRNWFARTEILRTHQLRSSKNVIIYTASEARGGHLSLAFPGGKAIAKHLGWM